MAKKVLTVDDSPTIRQVVKLTLSSAGYQVLDVASGQQALDACSQGPIDAVITDLNMPGMDGLELIRRIRSIPSHKFTPILMLTTESQSEKKAQGKSAGATGWIVKPFTPEQLVALVKRICPQA